MNTLNRFLAALLFIGLAGVSGVFFLCLMGVVTPSMLGLYSPLQTGLTDLLQVTKHSGRYWWSWPVGTVGVTLLALLLFALEIDSARPLKRLLVSRGETGKTVLEVSAIADLARWIAQDTPMVESIPSMQVERRGQKLVITATALLNPFAQVPEVLPALHQKLVSGIGRVTGYTVVARIRSRFMDPRTRRRVR